jgi:hypothetical protein
MSQLFQGKTELIVGENHTFNDIADAILEKLSKVEAELLIMVMQKNMKEEKFLKQEAELQALVKKVKEEKQ